MPFQFAAQGKEKDIATGNYNTAGLRPHLEKCKVVHSDKEKLGWGEPDVNHLKNKDPQRSPSDILHVLIGYTQHILSHPRCSGGFVLVVIINVSAIAFIGNSKMRGHLFVKDDGNQLKQC